MSERDTDATINYWVLGPLQVRDARGAVAAVTADKPRRLLTELLLRRNSWVDVDLLVDSLWGAAKTPASARGNLKTYVHQLRQLLPGDGLESPISSRRGSYLLTVSRGEVDSDVFEDLTARGRSTLDAGDAARAVELQREALDLWRGDPDREAVNPGAAVEAARLREVRWAARDGLADGLIADGRADQAVAMLRGLGTEEPLREATWSRLVTALREAGRPADALAAYQEIRENLVAELGAEPGSTLRELQASLLAETQGGDPAPEPDPVRRDAEPAPAMRRLPDDEPAHRPALLRYLSGRSVAVRTAAIVCALAVLVVGAVFVVGRATSPETSAAPRTDPPAVGIQPAEGIPAKRPVPGYPAGTAQDPKLLFGLGSEAADAARQPLATESPVGMLSSWYDGPKDLPGYEAWREQIVPGFYAAGKAMHLVVVPDHDEVGPVDTKYGPGCGKEYPLSPQFLDDMKRLATAFAGKTDGPPLYVSMFDGMQKISCANDEGYNIDPPAFNYYRAIKDRYFDARKIFHQYAPNARVALNWDGWQASTDDPESGSGKSLITYFTDALAASDFQSFTAHETEDNAQDVTDMVAELGKFGPVMVANFGPNESPDRTRSDLDKVFEPGNLASLTANGLFAWTFWEHEYIEAAPDLYPKAKDIVTRFARQ